MIQKILEYNKAFVKEEAYKPILPANTLIKNWQSSPVWMPG